MAKEKAEVKETKEAKALFPVIGSDKKLIRTYSTEIHGEDAEKLALQFAKKVGGEVL